MTHLQRAKINALIRYQAYQKTQQKISEEIYIMYRRLKAVASRSIYFLCSIFPIQQKKIVFSAFEGGGYACNPKYIAEELIRRMHKNNRNYELIWLVNDLNKKFPKEIHAVKNDLLNRAYHLSTAKIWIDNARKNFGTRKRQGQFYMQTWHGLAIKPVGRMRGRSFSKMAEIVTRYDAKLIDCFLCDSKFAIENFRKSFYNEPLFKIGLPRCDILVNGIDRQRKIIRQRLNLSQDVKLMLYAPTFRGGTQSQIRDVFQEESTLNFKMLNSALMKKFGGKWHILLRLHPQLALRNNKMNVSYEFKNLCTDISFEDDISEYLAAVDSVLTDYSSVVFDAMVMKIPIFIYADDLDDYIKERGKLIRNIYEYPFPVAKTNEELNNNIINFDEKNYLKKIENFFEIEEILEDGHASERAVDIIEKNL